MLLLGIEGPASMSPTGGTEDMRIGVDNFLKNGPKAKAAFVHR
jgi:hypothetical protein